VGVQQASKYWKKRPPLSLVCNSDQITDWRRMPCPTYSGSSTLVNHVFNASGFSTIIVYCWRCAEALSIQSLIQIKQIFDRFIHGINTRAQPAGHDKRKFPELAGRSSTSESLVSIQGTTPTACFTAWRIAHTWFNFQSDEQQIVSIKVVIDETFPDIRSTVKSYAKSLSLVLSSNSVADVI
jgi:hypothetical protein